MSNNNNKKQSVRFQCQECPKSYSAAKELTRHSKIHTAELLFSCQVCDKKFIREDHLTRHKNKHSKERPIKCETCGSAFKSDSNLKIHQNRMHSDSIPNFRCKQCPKGFKTKTELNRHRSRHLVERPFPCNICEQTFKLKYQLQVHLRGVHSNDPSFNCKICGKRVANTSSLSSHMRRHTGEKPYKCKFCKNKEFSRKGTLEHHIISRHSVISTTFDCDFCPKNYKRKNDLQGHLITVHNRGKNPESWLRCAVCQKSFANNGTLNNHMKIHTLLHKCGICGKGFPSKSKLEVHISRVHTKEKTNKCYFCKKSFNAMTSDFFNHLRIHTKEKPFDCSVCKKWFNCLSSLKRHSKKHYN